MDETPFVKVPSTLSASPQGRTEKPSRYAVFTGVFPEVLYDLPYREVMQDKKILSIALESERKFRAHALYTDGVLVVTHCLPISGPPMEWKNKLLKDIEEKTEKGFAVIVTPRHKMTNSTQ